MSNVVDLKTLDNQTLYDIWNNCINNRWSDIVGEKPEGFDSLPDKRKRFGFCRRAKQDYLNPIGAAARYLIPEEFLQAKVKEESEALDKEMYSRNDAASKILYLCYMGNYEPTLCECEAIITYCKKYPK